MPPEIGLGSDYELQDPLGLYSGSTGLGGKPAAPPAEPNAPPPPPAQVDQSAPAQPFASAGSEGEIRRGPDGKNYQYVETTGMAGATGANGWIPTSQSAPADAKQTAAPAGTPAHIPGNPAASGMARLAPPDPVAPAGKGGQLAFAHPGQDQLNPAFRTLLSTTSTDIGRNLMLTSAYRSPQHSVEAAKKEPGEHAHRDAADISMAGMDDAARAQLVSTLQANGAKRFITYSHEPDMLHVDMNSKRVSADNWFMYDRSHNNLGRAPKWFQDVAAGSKPLAATGSDDSAGASSAVAADENFKPSDPMGIYSGTTNPLAPKPIELRPFTAGEKRPNADGSYSTEVSTTFQLPDGQWVNVPSLWMGSNGKPKQFSPTDEKDIIGAMTAFEAKNGPTFARFPTVGAAEEAAQARSAAGGAAAGNPLGQKAAADPLQSIWQGMDKKEPGRYQVIPAADYEKWHKDWEAGQSSQIVKGFKGALLDQNPELLGNAMEAVGVLSDVQKMKDVAGVVKDWGKQGSYKRQAAVGSVSDIRTDTWSNMISDAGSYAAYSLGSGVGSMVPNVAVGLGVGTATANPVVGFVAGAAGPSYIQNLGDVYGSLRDDPNIQKRVASGDVTQKQVAGWAAAAAVPMAALDSVSLGKVLNIAGGKAIKDRLVKRIAKGIIEGSLTEGTTEALQQVISETVQEELGANKPLADKIISVVDNFIGGALTGGVAGGAGHASPHGGIDMAPGGPADAAAPVAPTAGPTAPAAPAPGASPGPTAPAAPATRKGPLAAALEHGERKAIERSNLPPPLPEGAPAIGVTVRVDAPGLQPFMGKIDSYQDGEAMLHDSASGEIYQIPISHLTAIAPSYEEFNKAADAKAPPSAPVTATPAPPIATPTAEPAAEKPAGIPLVITGGMRAELGNMGYDNTSIREMTPEMAHSILMGRTEHDVTDPALRPAFKETAPVTTAELPPREEQKPAVQAFPGPPAPGQRVIVDHPGIPRFSGKIETYEGDDVVVVDDNGTSQQVPLASLYVSKLQPKQIEAQDLARDPPAAREKPVLDKSTDRVVSNKTIIFPDTKHAGLYDLGKIRMESQRTMGVSVLDRGSVAPAEQAKIAAEFGVTPEAAGQMADDYRYRAERYGKEGRSALPIKMHAVNDRRLKQWQASAAKAAGLDVTAGGTDLSAWWDGELTAAGRKGILDATGIKRNERPLGATWVPICAPRSLNTAMQPLSRRPRVNSITIGWMTPTANRPRTIASRGRRSTRPRTLRPHRHRTSSPSRRRRRRRPATIPRATCAWAAWISRSRTRKAPSARVSTRRAPPGRSR
ncbi:hypothetical protein [Mesorhizobium huakuii]|uniref:hypothetical protein n=1 Tax=Mesorhizobium huakuii TaxID=28104 RepID=UPI001FD62C7C|nr:hypothetical protein [Mesorhizobium huakuii]